MGKLVDKWYDAVVISNNRDLNNHGAVQVKIIGVTDSLKVEDQPYALPCVNTIQAVPEAGTILRVIFEDGDINRPHYTHMSAELSALPENYVKDYPNIAVSYLGASNFIMTHFRKESQTIIVHPSKSSIIWNNDGSILLDSDKAYTNTGMGAKSNAGLKNQAVLTEATIDIFSCMPVGNNLENNGAHQGSEYLFASHLSQTTYSKIVNGFDDDDELYIADNNSAQNDSNTLILNDVVAKTSYTVLYTESPNVIELNTKLYLRVLVLMSGNNSYLETANQYMTNDSGVSAHFLIGKNEGTPSPGATEMNGIGAFVPYQYDAMSGSELAVSLLNRTAANFNAIVITLVGTEVDKPTKYQESRINDIYTDVKNLNGSVELVYGSKLTSIYGV